jgi:hypothetical protein
MPFEVPNNNAAIAALLEGGRALSQGILSGSSAIGDALGQMGQRRQMLKEAQEKEEKNRARQFNALVALGETAGMWTKDQAMTKSLEDLRGAYEGNLMKRKMEEESARLDHVRQQAAALQAETASEKAFPSFANQLTALGNPIAPMPSSLNGIMPAPQTFSRQPIGLPEIMSAAAQTGYRPKFNLNDLVALGNTDVGPGQIDTFDLPFGAMGVSKRGSKDLKVLHPLPDTSVLKGSDKVKLQGELVRLIQQRSLSSEEERAMIDKRMSIIAKQLGETESAAAPAPAGLPATSGKTKAGNAFRVVGGQVDLSGEEPPKPETPKGPNLTGIETLDRELQTQYQVGQEGLRKRIAELDAQIEAAAKPRFTSVSAGIGARPTQAPVSAEERAREVRRLQARRKELEAQLAK